MSRIIFMDDAKQTRRNEKEMPIFLIPDKIITLTVSGKTLAVKQKII